jgi:hypothetical protein
MPPEPEILTESAEAEVASIVVSIPTRSAVDFRIGASEVTMEIDVLFTIVNRLDLLKRFIREIDPLAI